MNFSLESFKSKVSDFIGSLGSAASPGKTNGTNSTTEPSFWQRYALNFGSSPAKSKTANDQALRSVAQKVEMWRGDGDDKKKAASLPAPKAIIIPLNEGKKQAGYDELSRRVTRATLEQNGIHPSNIEMEELMALPASKNLDMNGWLDKNWNFHDKPGLMPEAGTFKDINGKEVFGYKMTFSPKFQQSVIDDYNRIKGDLALTPDKKAVVDMGMNERLVETVKIAYDKGYISQEIKEHLGSLTPEELAATFALGGAIGIAATSAEAAAILGPVGAGAGLAYSVKQMVEFDHIARGAAKATNRDQLDQPAREFGQWMGQLSKEGVLAMVGAAGGIVAPKVMPRVEQVVTTKVAGVKEALTGNAPTLGQPKLAPAIAGGAPLEEATMNTPRTTGKTAIEKMQDPLEMRGRTNGDYADKDFPMNAHADKLKAKYPSRAEKFDEIVAKYPNGVKFDANGFPEFAPYATKRVEIHMKGNRTTDFTDANKAAGLKSTPEGYTWHHHQDRKTMELVPQDLHEFIRHDGGVSEIKKLGVLKW